MASNLTAMASNQKAVASTLVVMASNLRATASSFLGVLAGAAGLEPQKDSKVFIPHPSIVGRTNFSVPNWVYGSHTGLAVRPRSEKQHNTCGSILQNLTNYSVPWLSQSVFGVLL